jgi:hypothetical protein
MTSLIVALIVVLLVATVGSLFAGLLTMGVAGEIDDRNSTRLMFTRVGLQGLAVALIVLMLLVLKH